MHRLRFSLAILLLSAVSLSGQEKKAATATAKHTKDVDPLAMDVLRAVTQPIQQAQSFRFKALISEEQLASDGQMITLFRVTNVAVQRPDKIHLSIRALGQRVEFYTANAKTIMFAPDAGVYTTFETKNTIDGIMDGVSAKDIDMPVAPFLRTDLYDRTAKVVETAYVIGRVKMFDEDVHQIAFTSPDADWQMWVTGGEAPRIVRVEIINKNLEGKPRTAIQFLDWDLSPNLGTDEFTFTKPADAHEISMLPVTGGAK